MKKLTTLALVTIAALLCLAAPLFAGDINLFAAASLKEVLNELADGYAKSHPGVSFTKNYGGSGALAKQIENGAPADIFISANTEWMDYLKARRLADEKSIETFTYNELVFAGRPELKVSSMRDVVKLEKIAIGSPKSVPAGEYAVEAFKKAGIDKPLEKKLVMARDVRECLMYADRGEVDGAFVYRTDAQQAARYARILFTVPQEYYPRVTYPMALTTAGAKKGEAAAFYASLQTAEARAVLKKHGFIVK
jgi:molybdate transport system substrate-binding protein